MIGPINYIWKNKTLLNQNEKEKKRKEQLVPEKSALS